MTNLVAWVKLTNRLSVWLRCVALLVCSPAWRYLFDGLLWYFQFYFYHNSGVLWICSSALQLRLRLSWSATCSHRDPLNLLWQLSSGKNKTAPKCQVKIPAEQMSRWPSGCMLKSRCVACVGSAAWAVQNLVGNAGEKIPLQHLDCTPEWGIGHLFSEHSLCPQVPLILTDTGTYTAFSHQVVIKLIGLHLSSCLSSYTV